MRKCARAKILRQKPATFALRKIRFWVISVNQTKVNTMNTPLEKIKARTDQWKMNWKKQIQYGKSLH